MVIHSFQSSESGLFSAEKNFRRYFASAVFLVLLSVLPPAHAQQVTDQEVEEFFALAEWKLPDSFPPGPETMMLDDHDYRYYAATDTFLAVAFDRVWLLGNGFGDEVIDAGDFDEIVALLNALPDPPPTLWTVTVSGTIYADNTEFKETYDGASAEGRLVFRNFNRFQLSEVQLPDFENVEELLYQFSFSLAGEVAGIRVLFSAVVYDTPTRKALAVTFEAPHEKGTQTYYLFFDYTR